MLRMRWPGMEPLLDEPCGVLARASYDGPVPVSFADRTEYKRTFGVRELYEAVVLLPPAIATLRANRRHRFLDGQALERVMLAATEVNGCPACSWAHTRMALREGLSGEEISGLLAGAGSLPAEEATGIIFGQHYAESRGRPDRVAFDAVVREYGAERARTVLAAAQVMLAGNIFGIPMSALHARRRGTPYRDSSFGYEVGLLTVGVLVAPVAIMHGLMRWAAGAPAARWGRDSTD